SVGQRRINLWLDAEIVPTGRDARNHNSIDALAFGPGTIAVTAMVVAHFAAEIPGLPGFLVDERIVEINPVVVDASGSSHFHRRSSSAKREFVADKGRLGFSVGAVVLIGLLEDRLLLRPHVE